MSSLGKTLIPETKRKHTDPLDLAWTIANLDLAIDIHLVTTRESQSYLSPPYFNPFIQANLFLASEKTSSIARQQLRTLTDFLISFFYTIFKQSKALCARSFLPRINPSPKELSTMGRGAAWPPNSFGEWVVGQNFKGTSSRRSSGQTQILKVSLSEDEASGDETLQITYPGRRRGSGSAKQSTPKSSSSRKKVSFDSDRKPLKSALKKRSTSPNESSDTLVEDTSEDDATTEKDESSGIDESDTSEDEVRVKRKKLKAEKRQTTAPICKKETDSEDSSAVKDALPHETCDCKDCVKGRRILKAMIKLDAKRDKGEGSKKGDSEKQKGQQKGTKKKAEATSTEASETTETEATEEDKEPPSKQKKKKGQHTETEKKPSPKEKKKSSPKTAESKQALDKTTFKLPTYPKSMEPNLIMPIKSNVVQCEHTIEGPNDPRPNAFIDSGKGINATAGQPPKGPAANGLGLTGIRWPGTPPMLREHRAREKANERSETTNNVGPAGASGGGNQGWGNNGNANAGDNGWGQTSGGDGKAKECDLSFLHQKHSNFEQPSNKSAKGSPNGGWAAGTIRAAMLQMATRTGELGRTMDPRAMPTTTKAGTHKARIAIVLKEEMRTMDQVGTSMAHTTTVLREEIRTMAQVGTSQAHTTTVLREEMRTMDQVGTSKAHTATVLSGEMRTMDQVGTSKAHTATVLSGEMRILAKAGTNKAQLTIVLTGETLGAGLQDPGQRLTTHGLRAMSVVDGVMVAGQRAAATTPATTVFRATCQALGKTMQELILESLADPTSLPKAGTILVTATLPMPVTTAVTGGVDPPHLQDHHFLARAVTKAGEEEAIKAGVRRATGTQEVEAQEADGTITHPTTLDRPTTHGRRTSPETPKARQRIGSGSTGVGLGILPVMDTVTGRD
ncbi:hypothetical protein SLS63_005353 [Diaporthe eres]|uniref:Uncharacterized protein n=1 Tax=Diaporthe eres TaxID=83184 RepID=A0ABR1PBG5_DIAER